jgi:hypothetical protein
VSIEAVAWALNDAPVKDASALLVLIGLANHAARDGKGAYPSRETLSVYARCSVRTVAVKLKVLEESGVIVRGDQAHVAHLRGDRRPVVYDLNYDVQILHPVGSGYENDVQTEVERGEAGGNNDVQVSAHKPSLEPKDEPSVVVSNQRAKPARRGWYPSDNAIAEALSLDPVTEIPLHVSRYKVVKAERHAQPDSAEWLRWFIEDEKKARAEEREKEASRFRQRKWYDVAE